MERIVELSHLLTVTNSSSNLYIYFLKRGFAPFLHTLRFHHVGSKAITQTSEVLDILDNINYLSCILEQYTLNEDPASAAEVS